MLRQEICEGSGWPLRDRGRLARRRRCEPRQACFPVKVAVEIKGDEVTYDLTGSERRGSDRIQRALRGHDRVGDDVHHEDDLPRRGGLPGLRCPRTRGCCRPGQCDRAEGLDLQTRTSRAHASPASARRNAPSTSCPALPGAGRAESRSPPAAPHTCISSPTPASTWRKNEYWVYLEVDEGSYGGRLTAVTVSTRSTP